MADLYCANLEQLRQVSIASLQNCTEAYIGTLRRKFIWINNEGGQDDNETIVIPDSNPPSGRWICPQAPLIPIQEIAWDKVKKSGSSLKDFDNRSAEDIEEGEIHYLRLPPGVPYFSSPSKNLVLTTDHDGNYQLSNITHEHLAGLIPFAKLNWYNFITSEVGAESILHFDPNYFRRDSSNHVTLKLMSGDQPGIAIPGVGVETDEQARINIIYGTGDEQALEGTTPLGGDLSGEHAAAVVDALRNIPLTFFVNQLSGKDGFVLTLDVKNHNTPFFYLAPAGSGGGTPGGHELPEILGKNGPLLTDGLKIWWGKITSAMIQPDFAITSFYTSSGSVEVGNTISMPQFYASYNNEVTSASISDSQGHNNSLDSPFLHFTSPNNFQRTSLGSVSFTLSVVAADGIPKQASTSISWLARRYYGHLPLQTNPVNAINAMQSSELSSGRNGTFNVNAGLTEYIYFAFPSSFGTPTFAVGGFVGGFFLYASNILIVNSFGVATSYDIYQSDNLNLGSTAVAVS